MGKVTTGKPNVAGPIYRAPLNTTIPTDATTALSSSFVKCGYITEDGVKLTNDYASDVIKAWGGDVVLTNKTGSGYKFAVSFMEHLNSEVQKMTYGDSNVTKSGDVTTIDATGDVGDAAVYVIDRVTSEGKSDRIIIPNGAITAVGEVTFNDSSAIVYPITITAVSATVGNKNIRFREIIDESTVSEG